MSSNTPVVTRVSSFGDVVTVDFNDGHRATFTAYTQNADWTPEGLRGFRLFNGSDQVVQYDAQLYLGGPQECEHRFVEVAPGYTRERIVLYWATARDYIFEEFFAKPVREGRQGAKELWFPWLVITEGGRDLQSIEKGVTPLPGELEKQRGEP